MSDGTHAAGAGETKAKFDAPVIDLSGAAAAPAGRLDLRQINDVFAIRFPGGRADGNAVRELYEAVAGLLEHRDLKLLIDLTGVPLVTSGMMGMLITVKKKCMSVGGRLHIAVPDPMVYESFTVMNLHRVLNLFDTAETAMQRF